MNVFNTGFFFFASIVQANVPTLLPPELQVNGTWVVKFSYPDILRGHPYTAILSFIEAINAPLVPASSGFLPKVGHFVDAFFRNELTNLQGQYSKAKEKKRRVPQVMGQFT